MSAVRLGYVRIGAATMIWIRNSSHRKATVSSMPAARHTSQAGKKEPRMSKEGARPQPARTNAAEAGQTSECAGIARVSWPRSPRVWLNGIRGTEREIRQRREYLSLRLYLYRAGLGEDPLGRRHVQQVTNAVIVGFKGRRIGLGRGIQQRRARPLAGERPYSSLHRRSILRFRCDRASHRPAPRRP